MNENEEKELYLNNYKRKSFQWELWNYCHQRCLYCYLGALNLDTLEERQLTSLSDFNKTVDELNFKEYNNVSLIGGEFFQGECHTKKVEEELFKTLKRLAGLYNDKKVGSVWVTCTFTREKQNILFEWLDYCKENNMFEPNSKYGSSGLWLCTSWDTKGRFHTKEQLDNWSKNMKYIQKNYPFVKFNTTMILMEPFLIDYIEDRFSIKDFVKDYKTTIFFKQPGFIGYIEPRKNGWDGDVNNTKLFFDVMKKCKIEINEKLKFNFFPRREYMIKFLTKVIKNESFDVYDKIFNIKYRSDELHRNFNDREHDKVDLRYKNDSHETSENESAILSKCGHVYNYTCYVDSDKCCVCDKLMLMDLLE